MAARAKSSPARPESDPSSGALKSFMGGAEFRHEFGPDGIGLFRQGLHRTYTDDDLVRDEKSSSQCLLKLLASWTFTLSPKAIHWVMQHRPHSGLSLSSGRAITVDLLPRNGVQPPRVGAVRAAASLRGGYHSSLSQPRR